MATLPSGLRWWMWGVWGDLPAPNVFYAFGEKRISLACCTSSRRTRVSSSATTSAGSSPAAPAANAVLGSEQVLGFGSAAAGAPLPYAEVLTEVKYVGDRFLASEPHPLDEGSSEADFTVDLSPWVESRGVQSWWATCREVRGEAGDRELLTALHHGAGVGPPRSQPEAGRRQRAVDQHGIATVRDTAGPGAGGGGGAPGSAWWTAHPWGPG